MTRRVLVHCNAGPEYGMGHLMRSLAVIEQARLQNWAVTFGGDLSDEAIKTAKLLIPDLDLQAVTPGQVPSWLNETIGHLRPHVVHLDTYTLGDNLITPGDFVLSNMQDGSYGVRTADLAIDANFGSQCTIDRSRVRLGELVGVSAALIRNQVQRHRTSRQSRCTPPKILVVLGGTDPQRLTARVVKALMTLVTPTEMTIVCTSDQDEAIHRSAVGTTHHVTTHRFLPNLPAVASDQDLIVSAAGTSVWDFACMGIPMALICAVENQKVGYDAVTSAGVALPLGIPPHADLTSRVGAVDRLLTDEKGLFELSAELRSQVDGLGAWRLVSSWAQLLDTEPRAHIATDLVASPASLDDANVLFEWRNDVVTRSTSRSTEPVKWDDHLTWLERTIKSPKSQLLVVRGPGDNAKMESLGTVRWDHRGDGWEASITVAPTYRGRGLALRLLRSGEKALLGEHPLRLLAAIQEDNLASRRLFARAGYLPHLPADDDGFSTFARWLFDVE